MSITPTETLMPKKPEPHLTVTVKRRALLTRLEGTLAKQHRELRVHRSGGKTMFMLVDLNKNKLVEIEVDLESLARDVGALEPWEKLDG